MRWQIWMEGFQATGQNQGAKYLGSSESETFKEACISKCKDDPCFNEDKLSIWGCRLFDNESDARKDFG